MTGQQAYEEDCRRRPHYHDGSKRQSWSELCEVAKESWNRNPTPRNWDEQEI